MLALSILIILALIGIKIALDFKYPPGIAELTRMRLSCERARIKEHFECCTGCPYKDMITLDSPYCKVINCPIGKEEDFKKGLKK